MKMLWPEVQRNLSLYFPIGAITQYSLTECVHGGFIEHNYWEQWDQRYITYTSVVVLIKDLENWALALLNQIWVYTLSKSASHTLWASLVFLITNDMSLTKSIGI